MRIVHVINSLSGGGAEKLVCGLHDIYLKQGYQCYLVSLEGEDNLASENSVFILKSGRYNLINVIKFFFYLRRLKLSRHDILHAHLFPTHFYVALFNILKLIKASTVVTIHSPDNRRRKFYLLRLLDYWTYRKFNAVIAINSSIMLDYKSKYKKDLIFNNKLCVYTVVNGVDTTKLKQISSLCRADNEVFQILSVGRLVDVKNYSFMIDILSTCCSKKWHWTIAGTGKQLKSLQKIVVDKGISDKVTFSGFVNDTVSLYQASDLLLHLPLYEGFSLVIMESLAAGLPVVASDISGINDIIRRNHEEGFLVDLNDKQSIVTLLNDILERKIDLTVVQKNSLLRSQSFSLQTTAEKYISIYKEISEGAS